MLVASGQLSMADASLLQKDATGWTSADGRDWGEYRPAGEDLYVFLSEQACARWKEEGANAQRLRINDAAPRHAHCASGANKAVIGKFFPPAMPRRWLVQSREDAKALATNGVELPPLPPAPQ
jgi:hypothetical protein